MKFLSRNLVACASVMLSACSSWPFAESPSTPAKTTVPVSKATTVKAPAVTEAVEDDRPCKRRAFEKALAGLAPAREWSVVQTKDGAVMATIPSDPVFDRDSAQLKPESLLPLQRFAQVLGSCDQAVIHVLAYADGANGTSLSERRAFTVYDYLVREDVPAERIRHEGRGNGKPGQRYRHRLELIIKPIDPAHPDAAWTP